ncbi:nicotinate-nucleotide--dimethylbenzimidazole phosphoribosyltransferase, partial [Escherichia coli]|uniref:nicotinate-nucleotide--dimethylbenzimidazole phosphoribosyltransferase n=1 Tax=Escherichia coli TaxID=562 RepID=UPI001FCEF1E9
NQESRLPPGSDFRRWVWITIAPFVTLAACQMSPAIKPYLIPSHLSAEKGARIALSHLGLEPYLNMDMRLGEGSGAALAMPIIEAACAIYNNMGELAASNIVLPGNTTSDLNC